MKKTKTGKSKIVKRAVIGGILVLVVVLVVLGRVRKNREGTKVSTAALEKTSLQSTVDITGTVKSADTQDVYTTLSTYPVAQISVNTGDTVHAGDVLAVLDTKDLETQISQKEDALQLAQKSSALSVQQAKAAYDEAVSEYNSGMTTGLVSAKAQLNAAKTALDAQKAAFAAGQATQAQVDAAQNTYDSAQDSLTAAENMAQQSVTSAKSAYDKAVLASQDTTAQDALDTLKNTLAKATVTAPIDGTVTAVGAKVGAPPTGSLFTIQNTGDLIVEAEIPESDASQVQAGQSVIISTDATGSLGTAGEVASIAPAATVSTVGTGNATYTAKISLSKADSRLKIGMKAKLNIILQQKSDIYVVSYDVITETDSGSNAVFAAVQDGGVWRAKEVPVETGIENDVSVEISGSGLQDGMLIISNPDGITDGQVVSFTQNSSSGASSGEG